MTHSGITGAIHFVEHYGYALLFGWVLGEQAAVPIPSIPLLLAVGALIRTGKMNPAAAIACCVAGSLLADIVWFELGRHRGKRVLRFLCRVSLEPDSCVRQTEKTFLKYGLKTLLVAKFIPGLNAVAAPLVGDSGASLPRFLMADAAGVVIYSAAYMALGFIFSDQLEDVLAYAQRFGSGLAFIVAGLFASWILWKFIQRRRFFHQLRVARITPAELRDRIGAGEDLYIVDLRSEKENETLSIPGALRLSADQIAADPSQIPGDREVILVCS